MFFFILFIFGLFIGSFLNVLVDRVSKRESSIKGRSHCDNCKKTLRWHDLIPLVSFIFLKGKCRHCHTHLSIYYPIVELLTGIIFVIASAFVLSNFQFSIFNFQSNLNFQLEQIFSLIYYLFIVSSLIAIFFADLKYGIIPDKIVFPAIFVSFLYIFLNHSSLIINHLFSALFACLFFFLLFLITKGKGMGFGDVKFAFLIGLILGFPDIVVSLYIAFLTGAIVGCILIIWRKKRIFGTTIPFGPFLAVGTLISIFLGNFLFQNFLRLMALR